MKKTLQSVAVLSLLSLSLMACDNSSKSSNSSSGGGAAAELEITTVSGLTVGLNGSYQTDCHGAPAVTDSTQEFLTISNNVWTYVANQHAGSVTCTSASPVINTVVATLTETAGGDKAIVGWEDGDDMAVAAPSAADASGLLSNTAAYTPLTVVVTSSDDISIPVGTSNTNLYYIADDTGPALILYRDSDETHAGDFDFWTRQ